MKPGRGWERAAVHPATVAFEADSETASQRRKRLWTVPASRPGASESQSTGRSEAASAVDQLMDQILPTSSSDGSRLLAFLPTSPGTPRPGGWRRTTRLELAHGLGDVAGDGVVVDLQRS